MDTARCDIVTSVANIFTIVMLKKRNSNLKERLLHDGRAHIAMRLTAKRKLTFVFPREDAIGLIPSAYLFRTDVNVGFHSTFFTLGKTNEFALLSLNQNVRY